MLKNKGSILLRIVGLLIFPLLAFAEIPWNVSELSNPPQMTELKTTEPGVHAIKFTSVPLKGKPTQVFAYYGIPEGKNLPAMVLVHGGGGTAFAEWVRLWNQRGYAAIAMDTTGTLPETATADQLWNPKRTRLEESGPAGWGGFGQIAEPVKDQWTYHAVASVILAHSLIRSFPEVDSQRIGLTGISWGGYLTSIVSGVDSRFKFSAPIYGCGFLGEDSAWLSDFQKMGKDSENKWLGLWDPSVYLLRTKFPMLWVSGTNDFAYPLPSLQKSYRLPNAQRTLAIRVRMKHGHLDGAIPNEILEFANFHLKGGTALPKIVSSHNGQVKFQSKRRIAKAELNFTSDRGKWMDRQWKTIAANLNSKKSIATADVPSDATVWFFNLYDDAGNVVSSEHEYRDQDAMNGVSSR